jgi:succinate-semialdehyde dehydrogenase/glutarate-semialdehyde dehydrogenase
VTALVERISVRNPRTGEFDYSIAPPTTDEIERSCASLRAAQPSWAEAGIAHRIAVLRRWADSLEANAVAISLAETTDTGRSRVAREAPMRVANSIRGWCNIAPALVEQARLTGISSGSASVTYRTQLDPYPLVGVISPWNHPFLLSAIDIVPALLAGCAGIVKPSEITPRFVEPLIKSINDVPELALVLHYVVGGAETGQALAAQVDALCFTGSVATGRVLAQACARRFIPAFLELGGNDAAVVTSTADLAQAAAAVLRGGVHNTGQQCFATERVYVQATVHDAFVEELIRQASALELNYPDINRGHVGPFILGRQADIVDAHLADALERGAVLRCGGPSEELGGGRYMRPTVLTGVNHEMALMRDETFGPVIPVMAYKTADDAVRLANDTEFGLSGAVIAGSVAEAEAIGDRMNAGAISIQDTGLHTYILRDAEKMAYGASGLGGSRMGPNGLLRFLRRKAIIALNGPVVEMGSLAE